MTLQERLEKLSESQRQLLVEQLNARKLLKQPSRRSQIVAAVSGCIASQQRQLSDYLGALLPDYMVPSQWYFMDQLPRNTNGKLDRKVLTQQITKQIRSDADTDTVRKADGQDALPAEHDETQKIEQILSAIWAEVLFMDEVQPDDDYFELGGDSIASMQIVARASKHDLQLSTQDIMQYPSIRQLSQRLVSLQADDNLALEHPADQDSGAMADVMRVLNLGDQ